jgi:fluoroquinolone resistance protein
MSKEYTEDIHFKSENFSERSLPIGEYDHCSFSECNFLNADLSEIIFTNCTFSNSDLSMAKLNGTAFRDAIFKNCKMLGLRFDDCNDFSLSFEFESCTLEFSSFFKLKIKNTRFTQCKMESVDFVETDLSNAVFTDCDLKNAVFEQTKLEGADLRSAYNFSIDPEKNKIQKAKFSMQNIAGLLHKYNIKIHP